MNFKNLFPYCTLRGLAARIAFNCLFRSEGIFKRINPENINIYKKYRNINFECNICGFIGRPFYDFPNLELRREHKIGLLRETLHCRKCDSSMRDRVLARQLLLQISYKNNKIYNSIKDLKQADLMDIKILNTDAYSAISKLLKDFPNYIRSSFTDPENLDSLIGSNYYNINLEKIGFPDNYFDIVLTSDVMEHVRDIDAAHREIARILKVGGKYIFTVPYDPTCLTHHILVDTQHSVDRHLVKPQYHGDPINGGIIAYRVFGKAIYADLNAFNLNLLISDFLDLTRLDLKRVILEIKPYDLVKLVDEIVNNLVFYLGYFRDDFKGQLLLLLNNLKIPYIWIYPKGEDHPKIEIILSKELVDELKILINRVGQG
jgi:SAM-dependent methyltransferase